jgi:DNA processing protein
MIGMQLKSYKPEELLGPLNDVEAHYAPRELFVSGDISLLSNGLPRVAIIGTRHPSDKGAKGAEKLTKFLVKHEVIIISGLAEGIDTIVHCAAIDNGGRTIVVLGTSLEEVYPRKNRSLQNEIMQKHLAISQFPPGRPIQRMNFPLRNRTMALIADASVIVEAGQTSGTLSQGWETLRLGKPLFIYKSVCENDALSWPRKMIEYGAISLSTTDQILEILPVRCSPSELYVAF